MDNPKGGTAIHHRLEIASRRFLGFVAIVFAVAIIAAVVIQGSIARGANERFIELLAIDTKVADNTATNIPRVDYCTNAAPGSALAVDVVLTGLLPEATTEAAVIDIIFDPSAVTVTNVSAVDFAFGPNPLVFIDYDVEGPHDSDQDPPPGTGGQIHIEAANFYGTTTGATSLLLYRVELIYHGSDEPTPLEFGYSTRGDGSPSIISPGFSKQQIGSIQDALIAPLGTVCPLPPTLPEPSPLDELPPGEFVKVNEGGIAFIPLDLSREGIVVGAYSHPRYRETQPVAWELGVMTVLPIPKNWTGSAEAVNSKGEIAGWAGPPIAGGHYQALVWRDGVPEYLDLPCVASRAFDINNGGDIVGICIDLLAHQDLPFKITEAGFEFLEFDNSDDPGPVSVSTIQINDAGLIVLVANERTIIINGADVIDLGPSSAYRRPLTSEVNEQGEVLASVGTLSYYQPTIWADGTITSLNPPFDGGYVASALDDAGRVVVGFLMSDDGTVTDITTTLASEMETIPTDDRGTSIIPVGIWDFTDTGYFLIWGRSSGILSYDLLIICAPNLASPEAETCPVRELATPTPTPTPEPTATPTPAPTVAGEAATPSPTPVDWAGSSDWDFPSWLYGVSLPSLP